MQTYMVYTAGFPKEKREIQAGSPKEAALIHLGDNLYKNGIVVEGGYLQTELFLWSDMTKDFPELAEQHFTYRPLPPEEPIKKQSWWKTFLGL